MKLGVTTAGVTTVGAIPAGATALGVMTPVATIAGVATTVEATTGAGVTIATEGTARVWTAIVGAAKFCALFGQAVEDRAQASAAMVMLEAKCFAFMGFLLVKKVTWSCEW